MSLSTILIMLILVPLVTCLIMAVAPSKAVPQSFYESLHMVSVITVCCLSVYLVVQVFVSGVPVDAAGLWFRLDDLGAIFVTLIGVIGLLTGSYSLPYVRHDVERGAMGPSQVKQYYAFFSLFIGVLYCIVAGLMAVDIVPRKATGAALGIVGISSYVAAGLQDIVSGYLIEGCQTASDVYNFTPAAIFWLGACLLSFILPVLGWNRMKIRIGDDQTAV